MNYRLGSSFSQNQDPNLTAEAYPRKGSRYLLKNSAVTELVTAIGEAMRGRTYVSPLIADVMLSRISDPALPGVNASQTATI